MMVHLLMTVAAFARPLTALAGIFVGLWQFRRSTDVQFGRELRLDRRATYRAVAQSVAQIIVDAKTVDKQVEAYRAFDKAYGGLMTMVENPRVADALVHFRLFMEAVFKGEASRDDIVRKGNDLIRFLRADSEARFGMVAPPRLRDDAGS
jgi:hypothetical protein